ncbi:sigma-54 interaction domain-containing protein [Thermovenabulum gondwanense]|uniref:Arginine utilization regulatory protein RocR n=1 Tax=Thermovenabulum gondwanense TaxID=520767 RepID=A0A162N0C8_9FIRM|nr:sigma 54-interacting transcriptional regulator [Thermovenabulum gondwanense]KYO68628.1 Arginine utilization regulatory protein RocR [Thermovenabulum gondwanense]
MMYKKLVILSTDKLVKEYLVNLFKMILNDSHIEIIGYSIDEGITVSEAEEVVLTSGNFMLPVAQKLFPNSKIIGAKRIITGYNLEKVIMLPRGQKVLVVNNPRVATQETIDSLINLGITHLEYIPYFKGANLDLKNIDTAISPGMMHLCPEKIENKIDIGPRTVSPTTFLDVLFALGLEQDYLDKFVQNYNNLLMETSKKLALMHEQSEMLRKNQEIILNEVDEGILLVDEKGNIIIANQTVCKIFNIGSDRLSKENYGSLEEKMKKIKIIGEDIKNKKTEIVSIENKDYIVSQIKTDNGKKDNIIYTFKELSKIQKLEETVRIKLFEKGYLAKYKWENIWTINKKMANIMENAKRFAKTDKSILLFGETGTGKELFAQAIHNESARSNGPFVAINFAALPENLIESELFGYEEGAFTGAKKGGRPGLFEQAHGGTIFLDEIGDSPLNVQIRLLRVLQEKEIMRVGGTKVIPVDVRIIAATNKNLLELIEKNKFREDLFFRLNVLSLEIPPLRERKEDIFYILNKYFLEFYGIKKDFTKEAKILLENYRFPGNVRELINIAEFISCSAMDKEIIDVEDLPDYIVNKKALSVMNENLNQIEFWKGLVNDEITEAILLFLKEKKGQTTGRNTILNYLKNRNYNITEGVIKKYLKILKSNQLIEIGRKKQGCWLTSKGENYINLKIFQKTPYNK